MISTIACCVYVRKYEASPEDYDEYDHYENGGFAMGPAVGELNGKKSYQIDTQF